MPRPLLVQTNSGSFVAIPDPTPYVPTCDVCLQDGHSYKNCTHHCVADLHQDTLNLFIEYAIVSADTSRTRATRSLWAKRNRFVVTHLPLPLKRALVLRYTPQENKNYSYTSVTQWRERPTEENVHIPSRVGLISRASNTFINDLVFLLYDILSAKFLADNPQSNESYVHASNQFIAHLHNEINGLRYDLRNVSPESTTDVTSLLLAMRDIAINGMTDYIATVEPTRPAEAADNTAIDYNYENYHNEAWLIHRVRELCPAATAPTPTPVVDTPPTHRRPPPAASNAVHIHAFATELITEGGAAALTSQEDAPTCGICWDSLTAPTICTTNCNHHFCASCITQQAAAAKNALVSTPGYLRRNQRTPTLTCAMCRANVSGIAMSHEAQDTDAALTLNLVLCTTAIQGRPVATHSLPIPGTEAAPATPPPFPNIVSNDNDDPLTSAFAETISLLDELNAATDASH